VSGNNKELHAGCAVIVFVATLIIFAVGAVLDYNVSDGVRIGTISKLTHKGIVWKTWEGELVMGGLVANDTGANVFKFSLDHSSAEEAKLAERLNALADKGVKVKLHYQEKLSVFPWRATTKHLVVGAEAVGEAEKSK